MNKEVSDVHVLDLSHFSSGSSAYWYAYNNKTSITRKQDVSKPWKNTQLSGLRSQVFDWGPEVLILEPIEFHRGAALNPCI